MTGKDSMFFIGRKLRKESGGKAWFLVFFPFFSLYAVVNYSFGRQHVMGLTLLRVPQTAFHSRQTVIRFKLIFLLFVPKHRIVLLQLIRDTKQCLALWICLLLFCRRAVKYNLGCYNCKNHPLKGWLNPNTH